MDRETQARQAGRPASSVLMLVVVLTLVAVAAGLVFADRLESPRGHGDESGWVASSIGASALLAQANGDWRDWEGGGRNLWAAKWNPHLGQLLIGVPLPAALVDPPFDRYYRPGVSREDNRAELRIPPAPLLKSARINVAAVGVVLCVVAALAGWQLGRRDGLPL